MNLIALQSPSYRRYFVGSAAAVNGLWVLRVVVTWLAWDISNSASFVGLIAGLTLLPTILIGPFFGVIMDRTNIIRAAYSTTIAMMIAALAIIMALILDGMSKPFLVILAGYIGVIVSAHHPMRLSLGPRLVDRHQISSVSALASLNFNLARVISPFLAGVIIANMGVMAALVLVLIFYAPNLYIFATLTPRAIAKPTHKLGIFGAMAEGLAYIWNHKYLRLILLTSGIFSISMRAVFEMLPVIADGSFAKGAVGFGQLGAAVGVGSLIAAFFKTVGSADRIMALSRQNMCTVGLGILGMAAITTATLWPIALASAVVMGFAGTHVGISFQSEVQTDLPDGMRGRVMSLWSVVANGSIAVGAYIMGLMTDIFGLRETGIVISVIAIILVIGIAQQARKLR